ncbi:peptidylprolyl isomerase [Sesbania bispinosa]|nr:peptidylprolyl isomerase [Sesbania bispinosa]
MLVVFATLMGIIVKCVLKPKEDPTPLAVQEFATVAENVAPQSQEAPTQETITGPHQVVAPTHYIQALKIVQTSKKYGEGSQSKRQRKNANPRHLIPKSVQKERLKKKCLKKDSAPIPHIQTLATPSPPANFIHSAKDMQKITGLARQVVSGSQPDWNVVNKDIPISLTLLHSYNTMQQLADLAKTMTNVEGGNSSEGGATKPTHHLFQPKVMVPTQME